jgi:hypothetical protein
MQLVTDGKFNGDAEGLSKLYYDVSDAYFEEISGDSIKAMCQIGQP